MASSGVTENFMDKYYWSSKTWKRINPPLHLFLRMDVSGSKKLKNSCWSGFLDLTVAAFTTANNFNGTLKMKWLVIQATCWLTLLGFLAFQETLRYKAE